MSYAKVCPLPSAAVLPGPGGWGDLPGLHWAVSRHVVPHVPTVDEAWLEGHRDGHIGIFPKCFVVPAGICEEPSPVPEPQRGDQH
jgi:hypothetical protein